MTTENLKSALEYAVELNEHGLEILTAADGTEYYDANKFNLKELDPKRYPKTLELSTLTSLVDYLKTDLNNLKNQRLIVAVEKNDEVCVWSENDEIEHRTLLVDVKARIPELSFGRFLSSEQFNIMLQSNFIDDNDRGTLLEFASALKIENGAEIEDNGVSQVATVKTGVASLAKGKAPNPVTLRPYRTFSEVEQPGKPICL
ncbi:phage protein [Streptococcus pneumoniae]|nr:phage protein [Streptococcus pneumoniae]